MSEAGTAVDVGTSEDARLESLGYKPQLNRVLGFFSNFAVGFTYLSPMVGIYSLFVFGAATGGPAYIWLTIIPVVGMLFVALVFGELASHYPVAGPSSSTASTPSAAGSAGSWGGSTASRCSSPSLPSTPASCSYVTALLPQLVRRLVAGNLNPTGHGTILVITLVLLAIQSTVNITGARIMARRREVRRLRRDRRHDRDRDHPRRSTASTTASASSSRRRARSTTRPTRTASTSTGAGSRPRSSPCSLRSTSSTASSRAGDIAEETKDAGRQIPRAMRYALIWGGIGSLILTARSAARDAEDDPIGATVDGGGVPFILGQLLEWDAGLPAPRDHLRRSSRAGRPSRERAAGSPSRSAGTEHYPLPAGSPG